MTNWPAPSTPTPVHATVTVPGSKSQTNRALVLAALATGGWTRAGTVVVVERGTGGAELNWPDGWQPWPSRSYGDTRLELAERG